MWAASSTRYIRTIGSLIKAGMCNKSANDNLWIERDRLLLFIDIITFVRAFYGGPVGGFHLWIRNATTFITF